MPLIIRGNVMQSRGRVDWLPDANAAQPAMTFVSDPDTGMYRPGGNQLALVTGGTDRLVVHDLGATITGNVSAGGFAGDAHQLEHIQVENIDGLTTALLDITNNSVTTNVLTITGSTTAGGHILPAANVTYDLGAPSARFRDLYLSGTSIALGDASITEVGGNVVIQNLDVGTIRGDGSQLTGLSSPPGISNIQITDSTWTPIEDTVLTSNVAGYLVVNGTNFAPGSIVQIDGKNSTATSYISASLLQVQTQAKASGTYTVTVIRSGDGATASLASGVTYSEGVTWVTGSQLGSVDEAISFSIPIQASSDSQVTYANIDALPPQTSLDPVTGNLTGNITSVGSSTLYSFDIEAQDAELQTSVRNFILQFIVLLLNGTQTTNSSWAPLTQTALDSNVSTAYWTIDGVGMSLVTDVVVEGTSATNVTVISDTLLRVHGPAKPRGTYDVSIVTPSLTKVFPNSVVYSDVPVWVTPATLANVNTGTSFSYSLTATSDSAITQYANITNLPSGTAVNSSTGQFTGNISVTSDSLYTIQMQAMDAEMQMSLRTFSLHVKVPFYDSTILLQSGLGYDLQAAAKALLQPAWSQHATLVYRASDHGYTAAAFHSYCDGIAPLFLVIRANSGYIVTAYTVVPFTSSNGYKSAPSGTNWLNRLFPSGYQTTKWTNSVTNRNQYSIYDKSTYGPIFGSGHDLYIPDNFDTQYGYTNPSSYTVPTNSTLFGNYNTWAVLDMEAYAVVPPPFIPPPGTIPTGITYSQSSVYSTCTAATASDMQNNTAVPSLQTGTNNGAFEWVQMDLQQVYRVTSVVIGCDFYRLLPGGWSKSYAENRNVEYSTDGSNWTVLFNTGTFSEGIQDYAVDVDARYVRIVNNGYVAITEFYAVY